MKKIVIIGAGPAGLTAAYELTSRSSEFEVIVLEESNSFGGISKTVNHHGNRMDIGGHRFFSKDTRVTAWWEKIMPLQGAPSYDDLKTGREFDMNIQGPNPENEDVVMLKRRRVSRIFYNKKFFDYPIKLCFKTLKNMGFVTTVCAGCSYMLTFLRKKPEISLENFYINRFGYKLYSMFFEGYTEKLWGRHPRNISADWGEQRVKGLSIVAIIKDIFRKIMPFKAKQVETSLIEEFSYPKYGPGQLWEIVADKIQQQSGKIILNAKVTHFSSDNTQIRSVFYTKDGQEFELPTDIVISSMPLKDLVNGLPNVPSKISDIANGLPYRDFITVGLLIDKLALKNETKIKTLNNIIPDCWIYVQDTGVKLGRIQVFNNWSPYMVKKAEETVWLGLEYFCQENDDFWNSADENLKDLAVRELLKIGVISSKSNVLDFHVERIKKAYPAYFDTYKDIHKLTEYLDHINNLYCVGRNGQHRYNNMDHSMATSFLTADYILGKAKDKKAIWQVNTEKSYHETKK